MSRSISTNAIAFTLALSIGVGVGSLVDHLFVQRSVLPAETPNELTRITIESVPDADFPDAVKRNLPDLPYGTVRLLAVFDADGSIKSIRPYPMLPYGVSESAAGSGKFADVTPFMSGSRFVNSLPYGFTELAIEQVSKIQYKPTTQNGKPLSQRVFVLTHYAYTDSPFSVGCNRIDVTIMDDEGILWNGNTWVRRNFGCMVH